MLVLDQATGTAISGLHALTYVVVPLSCQPGAAGAGRQMTAVSATLPLHTKAIIVVIPLVGNVEPCSWSASAASITHHVLACFPRTAVAQPIHLHSRPEDFAQEEDRDDDMQEEDSEGDVDEGRHSHMRVASQQAKSSLAVPPACTVTFSIVAGSALESAVPAHIAAAVKHRYPVPFCFAVGTVPPSTVPTPLAFGAVHSMPSVRTLWVPTGQGTHAPPGHGPQAAGLPVKWDASIISVGTARRSDWSGGGKMPEEAVEDIRHRHASGTFTETTLPLFDWSQLRLDGARMPPEVVQMYAAQGPADVVPTGPLAGVPTLPRSCFTSGSCVPVDCIRLRKVMLAPDMDVQLALDDGTSPREED